MDQAVKYSDLIHAFAHAHKIALSIVPGRRFDKLVDHTENTQFFVERHTWEIYGAKSNFQFNPRRVYGTLNTWKDFDWTTREPIPGTAVHTEWTARENAIAATYKPRGRPRKVPATP